MVSLSSVQSATSAVCLHRHVRLHLCAVFGVDDDVGVREPFSTLPRGRPKADPVSGPRTFPL